MEEKIKARIAELEQARNQAVQEFQKQMSMFDVAIHELKQLIAPPPPPAPEPDPVPTPETQEAA